jgi:protein-disulfide isomerase
MSNRQARREQMRTTRQQRTQPQQRGGGGPRRPAGGPAGPRRRNDGLVGWLTQPFTLVTAGVVVVLAAILAVVVATGGNGGNSETVTALKDARETFPYELADGRSVGRADAPLTLEVFEDFQCPFCLRYTAMDEPTIIEEYVKTGKLRIEFKHFPILGVESQRAHRSAVCAAEQGKFWQYHHALFLSLAEDGRTQHNVGVYSDSNLRKRAEEVGLDLATYDICIQSAESLAVIQGDQSRATSYGLRSTPSFLINGTSIGQGAPGSLDAWRTLLDDAYQQVTSPSPTPSPTGTATGTPTATATATATSAQ